MRAFVKLLSIEMKLNVREFSGVLFGIMIPVGLMCLLGVLYDTQEQINQAVPAVLTIGICATGLMGIPITLSAYREKKLLRRFQVTPTSPLLLMGVQFVSNMVIALVSSSLVVIVGLFFGFELQGSVWKFLLLYLLILFAIYAVGLLIASVSRNVQMSNLLCSLVYFPMFFLSGATIPYEIMPKPLQMISSVMPLSQGIKILKGISAGEKLTQHLLPILILLTIGVLCIMVSVRTFKYDYE